MNKGRNAGLRTWIEVDTKAIKHNFQAFRKAIPKTVKLGAVVKSNAYGHDLYQFSKEVEELGADWIIVDSIVEARALRTSGIRKPLLVLGHTLPQRIPEAVKYKVSLTISSLKNLNAAAKIAKEKNKCIKVHVKVDTGLSRQGFLKEDMKHVMEILKRQKKWLEFEGLYTHFSAAKKPGSGSVRKQMEIFNTWIKAAHSYGFSPETHTAATAAVLLFPETHLDMVRVGIGLYGLWPSLETKKYLEKKIRLRPILAWKTVVGEIKKLPKGALVGYDGTEKLKRDSTLAVCPVGYWHGYDRKLSSLSFVLVKGKRAKVMGRVSMDIIVIDISNIKGVKEGDEVVLIGKQGRNEITAYELAEIADTSWYEIVTRLNPLIKRIYL